MAFQRGGESRRWDEYRNKISPVLLAKWGGIMIECRRNGFINPTATHDDIEWMQVISTSNRCGEPISDLCIMCERPCNTREEIDSGRLKYNKIQNKDYVEPKKCYE